MSDEAALSGRSIDSNDSVVALGDDVGNGTPKSSAADNADSGKGSTSSGVLGAAGAIFSAGHSPRKLDDDDPYSAGNRADSQGSHNEPFEPSDSVPALAAAFPDAAVAAAAAAAAIKKAKRSPVPNEQQQQQQVNASPRGVRQPGGDIVATTATSVAHHVKHSAQQKHVPKIVAQEKEQRQRAAEEMLWMAPTDNEAHILHANQQQQQQQHIGEGAQTTPGSLVQRSGSGAGAAAAIFPSSSASPLVPSGHSDTNTDTLIDPKRRSRILEVGSSSSVVALDDLGPFLTSADISPSGRLESATLSSSGRLDARCASPKSSVLQLHQLQPALGEHRAHSVEYFVKTEHGASKASIRFDSQQECMQLSDAIGHGRTGSQGMGPAAAAASAGSGASGAAGDCTSSGAHGRTGSLSMLHRVPTPQSNINNNSNADSISYASHNSGLHHLPRHHHHPPHDTTGKPSAHAVDGHDAYNFTPEQLAAIAAFDDGKRFDPTAPRRTTSGSIAAFAAGATGGTVTADNSPSPTAAAAAAAAGSTSDQQHSPAARHVSGHSSGRSLTFYARNKKPQPLLDIGLHNPLGQSQAAAAAALPTPVKGSRPLQTDNSLVDSSSFASAASAATAPLASIDPAAANVLYAGFGPRDRIEVPAPPHDSAWKQNTLRSIRVELDTKWTLVALIVVIATCVPLGVALMTAASAAQRVDIYYDEAIKYRHPAPLNSTAAAGGDGDYLWNMDIAGVRHRQGKRTFVRFNLSETMTAPILFSYGMTNFYHNHLNVHQSKSLVQLAGLQLASSLDTANCEPALIPGALASTTEEQQRALDTPVYKRGTGAYYAHYRNYMYHPCGVLPWAKFNDTFVLWRVGEHSPVAIPDDGAVTLPVDSGTSDAAVKARLTRLNNSASLYVSLICNGTDFSPDGTRRLVAASGADNPCEKTPISIRSDRSRFAAPDLSNNNGVLWMNKAHRQASPAHFVDTNDTYITEGFYAGEPGHELPNLYDLDFQVWMRVAPLPTFRKLYRVINVDLVPGQYQLEVDEYFDSTSYNGRKFISLETRPNKLGGMNYAFATVYLATGGLALLIACLTALHAVLTGDCS